VIDNFECSNREFFQILADELRRKADRAENEYVAMTKELAVFICDRLDDVVEDLYRLESLEK